jgi:hypothetical protein
MIRFLAIVVGSYAAYSVWAGFRSEVWGYAVFGVACGVTAIAMWLRKPWSQYLLYVLGALFIGIWIWSILQVVERGWPYESVLESGISLVPGLLMVGVIIGSCWVARKAFTRER